MTNEDWYSQDEINARAKEQEREDFRDLQDEIAGRDTGKATRFTSDENRTQRSGEEPDAKKQSHTDLSLQILMENSAYRSAYVEAMQALQEAEYSAQIALDETQDQLSRNDQKLADIESRASTLPDGTRVYRDKDGNVFDEDGSEVGPLDIEAIVWRDDNPSFEDFKANREHNTALQERVTNIYDYQVNTLGYIRGRMKDSDDPLVSVQELQEAREEISNRKDELFSSSREEVSAEQNQEYKANTWQNINVPTLN